jgi:hypothetical protein
MLSTTLWPLVLCAPFSILGLSGLAREIIQIRVGNEDVTMVVTGSAVRTKSIFKVYSIKSYIEAGHKVRTAPELIAADCAKQMHLVFLLSLDGPTVASAFEENLRANHPAPEFAEETAALVQVLYNTAFRRGDEVWFTHVPNVGFHCRFSNGSEHRIDNVEFSRAIWENYLGRYNSGERVKRGLLERLPKD